MSRSLALGFLVNLLATILVGTPAACTSNGASAVSEPRASGTGGNGARPLPGEPDSGVSNPNANQSTCEITRAYLAECSEILPESGMDLTCGPQKFEAWCTATDEALNSEAYRRAEAMCLTSKNCHRDARHDCEYRSYATATPTAAQTQLVAAFCQTCEPSDPAGCASRKTTYDPAKGPRSTDDVFTAAWELNDTLVDEIRAKCTGAAAGDAGTPEACLERFGTCAGGIYVDALPDCP